MREPRFAGLGCALTSTVFAAGVGGFGADGADGASTTGAGASRSIMPSSEGSSPPLVERLTDDATFTMFGADEGPDGGSRSTGPPTLSSRASTSSFRRSNSRTREYHFLASSVSSASFAMSPRWRRAMRFSGSIPSAISKGCFASAFRPDSKSVWP